MMAINYKNNNFNITEPFQSLFTQGMVCHETYKDENNNWLSPDEVEKKDNKFILKGKPDKIVKVGPSESMSKSKKNVIDPEFIISNYGADSVRLFILSDSPPEKDVQWSEQGMASSYKFIQKLWILHTEVKNKILNENKKNQSDELEKFTNQMISKITGNLDKFNYNVIIANMYETYNYLVNFIKMHKDIKNLKENYKKIIICFFPVIPHLVSECLEDLRENKNINWPDFDKKMVEEEEISFVIQINGKKRAIINESKDIEKDKLLDLVKKDKMIQKYINQSKINKIIFVKNRLMNILLDE